jgi:hypothetical protein
MSSMERRKYEEAGRLIDRALEIEPDNAMPPHGLPFGKYSISVKAGLRIS